MRKQLPHTPMQQHVSKLPKNSVVCVMAPTASGKTALAYELYKTGEFEIISVDSALVYRDMNIGTAKPTEDELIRYPHHLVDIIEPTDSYSVANFVADVEVLIKQIHTRGKTPLLVGGTMMYYMALFSGLSAVPDTNKDIRAEVEAWRIDAGIEALYDYLSQVDPIIAKRLNKTDTQRITRAVEVYKQTGKPLSDWQQLPKRALSDNPNQYWLGLVIMPDRQWLHQRIEQRLAIMWQSGFVEEVLFLLDKYPLTLDTAAMRCVGYRQVVDYLIEINHPLAKKLTTPDQTNNQYTISINKHNNNEVAIDKEDACNNMQNRALYATRQLAKRQYTWLRNLTSSYSTSVNKCIDILDFADWNNSEKHIPKPLAQQKYIFQPFYPSKEIQQFKTMEEARSYLFSRL